MRVWGTTDRVRVVYPSTCYVGDVEYGVLGIVDAGL